MRKGLAALAGVFALASIGVGTAGAQVLVDQSGTPEPFGLRSDKYAAPTNPDNDVVIADDFTVPAGEQWTINSMTVFGTFDLRDASTPQTPPPPPPAQLNIRIYVNTSVVLETFPNDFPGAIVYQSAAPLPATGGPNYTVAIPNVPALSAGHYWISVQQDGAQYNNANDGQLLVQQWFWQAIPASSGSQARMMAAAQLPGSCAPWPGTPWNFTPGCDGTQDPSPGAARAAVTPRGGPPPVDARMTISGNKGSPGAANSPAQAKCGKHRVRRHGKCVKKKSKAKRVNPGFTG